MTSIVAIISAYFLHGQHVLWGAIAVVLAGVIQFATKSKMNEQFRTSLRTGADTFEATSNISDTLTQVNMVTTFIVWGFGLFALWLKFS